VHLRESVRKNWIIQGIQKLQQKYAIFIYPKKNMELPSKNLGYIEK
jgi:hypothetical protein